MEQNTKKACKCSAITFWALVFAGFQWAIALFSCILFGTVPVKIQLVAFSCVAALCLLRESLRPLLVSLLQKRMRSGFAVGLAALLLFLPECALRFYQNPALSPAMLLWLLPAALNAALLAVLSFHGGKNAAFCYRLPVVCKMLLPFQAAAPTQLSSLAEILLLCMYLILLDCELNPPVEKTPKKKRAKLLQCISGGALAFIICFAWGLLPWRAVSVATGSMEPKLKVGDAAIVYQTENIAVGDVIQFQSGNHTVLHRVIKITQLDGQTVYITKGDANSSADAGVVQAEDVTGKVVSSVPYLGWLTLWLHAGE